MIVVAATIITMVEYTFEVRIPDDIPTPATIKPTSPLEIIPIPPQVFWGSFVYISAGKKSQGGALWLKAKRTL